MKHILEDQIVKDLSEAIRLLEEAQELAGKHYFGSSGSLGLSRGLEWLGRRRAKRIAALVDEDALNNRVSGGAGGGAEDTQGAHHSDEAEADTSQVAETEHALESHEDSDTPEFRIGDCVTRKGDTLPMRITFLKREIIHAVTPATALDGNALVRKDGPSAWTNYLCEWTTLSGRKTDLWFKGSDLEPFKR